jgi:hypothetical protein
MKFRLRTLMLLMAIGPPLIAFWPNIQRRAVARVLQISSSDVAVVAATSSLIAIRVRLHLVADDSRAESSSDVANIPTADT